MKNYNFGDRLGREEYIKHKFDQMKFINDKNPLTDIAFLEVWKFELLMNLVAKSKMVDDMKKSGDMK